MENNYCPHCGSEMKDKENKEQSIIDAVLAALKEDESSELEEDVESKKGK